MSFIGLITLAKKLLLASAHYKKYGYLCVRKKNSEKSCDWGKEGNTPSSWAVQYMEPQIGFPIEYCGGLEAKDEILPTNYQYRDQGQTVWQPVSYCSGTDISDHGVEAELIIKRCKWFVKL